MRKERKEPEGKEGSARGWERGRVWSFPQGRRRAALRGRRKGQGDKVGKGHTRGFSLDHMKQSPMAPNEEKNG